MLECILIVVMLKDKSLNEVATCLLERGKAYTASLKFKTYYQKVKRLSDTYSKVKKSKNEDYINEFMNKEFQLPSLCITQSLSTSQTQRELSRLQPDLTSASYVVSNIAQELNS